MNGGTRRETARSIPLVSCDYLYINKSGIFGSEELFEDEREGSSCVLAMYCESSHAPFANRVPRKGDDAGVYVVECMRLPQRRGECRTA